MNHFIKLALFFTLVVLGAGAFSRVYGEPETSSPISVTVETAQKTFKTNSPLEGKVTLFNASSVVLPATFDITVFLNGQEHHKAITAIKPVLPATTTYSFEEFGVRIPPEPGLWKVVIQQQNTKKSTAAITEFTLETP